MIVSADFVLESLRIQGRDSPFRARVAFGCDEPLEQTISRSS